MDRSVKFRRGSLSRSAVTLDIICNVAKDLFNMVIGEETYKDNVKHADVGKMAIDL